MGLLFHLAVVVLLALIAIGGMERAAQVEGGIPFLAYLFPALAAMAIIPWILYRVYALATASYSIERGGIRLQWGLRVEDIPMNSVRWVHPAANLRLRLPLPWLRWPGSLLGLRRLSDGKQLEFLASHAEGLLVIGTPERWFAISPARPDEFLQAFQHLTELGTFEYLPTRSARPALLLTNFWADLPARLLIVIAFILGLGLFTWVSLAIPGRSRIPFHFGPEGIPSEYAPAVRLMLLPVLNGIVFAVDLLLGMFFYRRSESQVAAYLLWISSIITVLLFFGAVYFILHTP